MKVFLLIRDRTSSGSLPLSSVVNMFMEAANVVRQKRIVVGMACGYGLAVNDLDDRTERGPVRMTLAELMPTIDDERQWFDELRVRAADGSFHFGVFDSGCVVLFADETHARKIASRFEHCETMEGVWSSWDHAFRA